MAAKKAAKFVFNLLRNDRGAFAVPARCCVAAGLPLIDRRQPPRTANRLAMIPTHHRVTRLRAFAARRGMLLRLRRA